MRFKILLLVNCLLVLLLITTGPPLSRTQAQNIPVRLSLALPAFLKETITPKLLEDFAANTPGVSVELITSPEDWPPLPAMNLQDHLRAVEKHASAADVFYVREPFISPAGTQAGYFLDLAPLVNADQDLHADDFYPAVWRAFQWDKAIWALPFETGLWVLTYDPKAFDEAGIPFPTADWQLSDLESAIRKLAKRSSDGKVTQPGMVVARNYDGMLARSFIGEGLYDESVIPNVPKLDTPAVEQFAEIWARLLQDGSLSTSGALDSGPLSVSSQYIFLPGSTRRAALLPGGKSALEVQGLAVSAGTQHPQEAYALVRFLIGRPELTSPLVELPAYQRLTNNGSTIPSETRLLFNAAIENAFSSSEMRYMDYLDGAIQRMIAEGLGARSALQLAQRSALKDQTVALAWRQTHKVVVQEAVPATMTPTGTITIKFGVDQYALYDNQSAWNRVVQEFATSNRQAIQVTLESDLDFMSIEKSAEAFDCFYFPASYKIISPEHIGAVISLDPYLTADPDFDKSDFLKQSLEQVTIDNRIWGYPLNIAPDILRYNIAALEKAGLAVPEQEWTLNTFIDALKILKPDPAMPAALVPIHGYKTYMLLLIAAYGGLPLDYRTSPPTLDFTSSATTEAARQALDLAKQGYIKYESLGRIPRSGDILLGGGVDKDALIYTDRLGEMKMFGASREGYQPVFYPHGTRYQALAYDVGVAYISRQSSYADACYRWINTLAQHPDLFPAIPARRSMLDNPALAATQGRALVARFHEVDRLLQDPSTVIFPSDLSPARAAGVDYFFQHWLYEAFDSYVFEDGDLETALKDAQLNSQAFLECTTQLPPYDASTQEMRRSYWLALWDCAAKVDPKIAAILKH